MTICLGNSCLFGTCVVYCKGYQFVCALLSLLRVWSGGVKVLGKLPVPGRPTILITVGQGPTALAVGAGGGCLDILYSHLSFLFSFSLSLGDGLI